MDEPQEEWRLKDAAAVQQMGALEVIKEIKIWKQRSEAIQFNLLEVYNYQGK